MAIALLLTFLIGYVLIAFEHPLKIDKAATALLTGVICWVIVVFGIEQMPAFASLVSTHPDTQHFLRESLFEHMGEISEILFFLLGAMTIVELVDVHDGFRVITDRITTSNRVTLLWIISWVTFVLSAALDNLTTTILMCALLRRIIHKHDNLFLFGGFVVIAANAGGAWSPIGDVTTIMLWIGGQVTTFNIITATIAASIFSLLVPLLVASYRMRHDQTGIANLSEPELVHDPILTPFKQKLLFVLGGAALLSVPVFKAVTHLPPYMGILLAVGILWYITEIIHWGVEPEIKKDLSVAGMLHRIDTPSILFFLGILLAVGSLDASGHLDHLASWLNDSFGNIYVINTLIGTLSAVIDNVPLVAACMGMYDLAVIPVDSDFWKLLAYCAGTGGSMLIIGSAAGVAAMGIIKIDFLWYLKHISIYALIGYLSGIVVYYIQHQLLG